MEYRPQNYPLYAMVVDTSSLDQVKDASVCAVIGWEVGLSEMFFPVLVQLMEHENSEPVNWILFGSTHYKLLDRIPTKAKRMEFLREVREAEQGAL